jgi:hypothetical protein
VRGLIYRFKPEENAKRIIPVNMAEELSIQEFQDQLLPCHKPEGYGSKVYAKQMMGIGQYKVHVSGLSDYNIPNGFYMVREEFAKKLLRYPVRKKVRTGLMFAGKLVTLAEYYSKNEYIVVDIPDEEKASS